MKEFLKENYKNTSSPNATTLLFVKIVRQKKIIRKKFSTKTTKWMFKQLHTGTGNKLCWYSGIWSKAFQVDLIVVQKHHPSTCQKHRRRRMCRHALTGPPCKWRCGATCQRGIRTLIHTSGGTCFSKSAPLLKNAAACSWKPSLPTARNQTWWD